jgi:hypothetical protein
MYSGAQKRNLFLFSGDTEDTRLKQGRFCCMSVVHLITDDVDGMKMNYSKAG